MGLQLISQTDIFDALIPNYLTFWSSLIKMVSLALAAVGGVTVVHDEDYCPWLKGFGIFDKTLVVSVELWLCLTSAIPSILSLSYIHDRISWEWDAAPDPVRTTGALGSFTEGGGTVKSNEASKGGWRGKDVYFEAEGLSAHAGSWSHMQVVDSVARQIKKSRPRVDLPLKWEWGLDIRQKT